MSGRLIITTKKSYCPWNAANVERVLRDERLERERLARQQREENQPHNRRDKREPQGHINLFPEAREAEIRLTQVNTNDVEKNDSNGILNVPLGGDESKNRKNGKVPFYMQAQSREETYDKSSYIGIRGSRSGAAPADTITDTLMRDQFTSREEYRKQKNDPMRRFYDDSTDATRNVYANRESSSRAEHDLQSNCHATSLQETDYSLEPQPQAHGRTKSRKRKSNSSEDADDNDEDSEASSSSLSSSTSSWDSRRRKRGREHDHKKNQRSKHSSSSHSHHRRKKSPLHYKKKRRKDKKTKRKRRSKDRGEDEGDRPERHHHPSFPQSNIDSMKHKKSDTHQLEDMRRRRHAREAREIERQRRLV